MSCKEVNLKLVLKSEIIVVKWIRWCYYNAVPRAGFACRLWIYLETWSHWYTHLMIWRWKLPISGFRAQYSFISHKEIHVTVRPMICYHQHWPQAMWINYQHCQVLHVAAIDGPTIDSLVVGPLWWQGLQLDTTLTHTRAAAEVGVAVELPVSILSWCVVEIAEYSVTKFLW